MARNDYFYFSLYTALFPKSWRQPSESDESKIRRAVSSLYIAAVQDVSCVATINIQTFNCWLPLLLNYYWLPYCSVPENYYFS